MSTRSATSLDSFTLSSLCADVQRFHAQNHPGIFKMPASEDFAVSYFEEILADPAVTTFLAEANGDAVGYIVCRLVERQETVYTFAARTLLVDQISVRPKARGKGFGAALLKQAELLARQLDVERIRLDSWDFNIEAHGFFESQGYKKFTFRFWRIL
jgi:GNAT superfamily N-acetyltransferase